MRKLAHRDIVAMSMSKEKDSVVIQIGTRLKEEGCELRSCPLVHYSYPMKLEYTDQNAWPSFLCGSIYRLLVNMFLF